MGLVGHVECFRALGSDLLSGSVVDTGGRVPANPAMAMLVVIPREESLAEGSGLLNVVERFREIRSVLQRLELRLRKRIIVWLSG